MSGRIVVGVDGSPPSQAALGVAVDEARLRGATLQAVHVWNPPALLGPPEYAGYVAPRSELEAAARTVCNEAVADVPEDVGLDVVVVEGPIAPALIERSEGAELLVVGSRGRGGFAGLLLGSTSHQATSHATCPVLVVPAAAVNGTAQAA